MKIQQTLFRVLSVLLLSGATWCHAEIHIEYTQGENSSQQSSSPSSAAVGLTSREYHLIIAPADAESSLVPSNNKAYQIITYLFGTMDPSSRFGSIVCIPSDTLSCSTLMGNLFSSFNSGLLIFATLLLTHVITQSAFSDASQGFAAGQKYSHNIIPFRSAVGLACLVPTKTGYCYGQILVAKILLLGSSAATGLWQNLVLYYDATGEPLGSGGLVYGGNAVTDSGDSIAEMFVQNMAKITVCNAYLNTSEGRSRQFPTNAPPSDEAFVTQFSSSDNITYTVLTGIENANPSEPYSFENCYCGKASLGPLEEGQFTIFSNYESEVESLSYDFMSRYNFNTNTIPNPTDCQTQFTIVKNMLKTDLMLNGAAQAAAAQVDQSLENRTKTARQASEWFDAPTYFFKMLSHGNPSYNLDVHQGLPINPPSLPTDPQRQYVTDFSTEITPDSGVNMKITFPGNSGATKDFQSHMKEMLSAMDQTGDALLGLAKVGRKILQLALDLMIVSFTFSFILVTLTGIASNYTGVTTFGMMAGIMTVIVALIQAIGFLVPIASVFAIGLPLVPLITFTSAIITWIFFCVIAIFAAPVMCLGLISHGDGLGNAKPAFLMIVNLFMRPSLNVIGLVAGAKLFNIFYLFFTQGYLLAVNDIMGAIGIDDTTLMSIMGIIFLYAYTFFISAGCTRCYSLIYHLPDQFLIWVGAPALSIPESTQGLQAAKSSLQVSSQNTQQKFQEFTKGAQQIFDQSVQEANRRYRSKDYTGARDLKADAKAAAQALSDQAVKIGSGAALFGSAVYDRASQAVEISGAPALGRMAAETSIGKTIIAKGSWIGEAAAVAKESTTGAIGSAASITAATAVGVANIVSSSVSTISQGVSSTIDATGLRAPLDTLKSGSSWVAERTTAGAMATGSVLSKVATGDYSEKVFFSHMETTQRAYADRNVEFQGNLRVPSSEEAETSSWIERGIRSQYVTNLASEKGFFTEIQPGTVGGLPISFRSKTIDNLVYNPLAKTALGLAAGTAIAASAGYTVYAYARTAAEKTHDFYNRNTANYVPPQRSDHLAKAQRTRSAALELAGASAASAYVAGRTAVTTLRHGSELTGEEKVFLALSGFIPSIPGHVLKVSADFMDGFDKEGREKMKKLEEQIQANTLISQDSMVSVAQREQAEAAMSKDQRRLMRAALEQKVVERNLTPVITGSRVLDFSINTVRGSGLIVGGLALGTVAGIGNMGAGLAAGTGYMLSNMASNSKNRAGIAADPHLRKGLREGFKEGFSAYATTGLMASGFRTASVGSIVLARTLLSVNAFPVGTVSLESRAGSALSVAIGTVMDKKKFLSVTHSYQSEYLLKAEKSATTRPALRAEATHLETAVYASQTLFSRAETYVGSVFVPADRTGWRSSRILNTGFTMIGGTVWATAGLVSGTVNIAAQTVLLGKDIFVAANTIRSNFSNGVPYKDNVIFSGWSDVRARIVNIQDGFRHTVFGISVVTETGRTFSAPQLGLSLEGKLLQQAKDLPQKISQAPEYLKQNFTILAAETTARAQAYRAEYAAQALKGPSTGLSSGGPPRSPILQSMTKSIRSQAHIVERKVGSILTAERITGSRTADLALKLVAGTILTGLGLTSGSLNAVYRSGSLLAKNTVGAGSQLAFNIMTRRPYKDNISLSGWKDITEHMGDVKKGFRHTALGLSLLVDLPRTLTAPQYTLHTPSGERVVADSLKLAGYSLAQRAQFFGNKMQQFVFSTEPAASTNSYAVNMANVARGASLAIGGGAWAVVSGVPYTVISITSALATGKDLKYWIGFDGQASARQGLSVAAKGANLSWQSLRTLGGRNFESRRHPFSASSELESDLIIL